MKLTGTDRQADRQADRQMDAQDHVLSQADALTKKEYNEDIWRPKENGHPQKSKAKS